jgi:conjugative transposon TraN protein
MKNNRFAKVLGLLVWMLSTKSFSQNVQLFAIEPFPLEITYNKTINLIFAYGIKSVDKGSRSILAQKAKGVENILQLKAAAKGFEQTNLTVITSDGKLYSFVVNYSDDPLQLNIEVIKDKSAPGKAGAELTGQLSEEVLENTALKAAQQQSHIRRIRDSSHQAKLALDGIYISQDVIFYRIKLANRSAISYDIESLRFFISDKKRAKRTAVQQTEIQPLYIHGDTSRVGANNSHEFVFALPKFTIPDAKDLTIQIMEKDGGRHMVLHVQNRTIVRAKTL